MRSAERRKVNVLEMKYLRSLVEVSRMNGVRTEEVRRKAGIEMELVSRADQRAHSIRISNWTNCVVRSSSMGYEKSREKESEYS